MCLTLRVYESNHRDTELTENSINWDNLEA